MKEIYVVGYPRSGNSWLSWLLGDILNSPVKGKFYATPISQEGLERGGEYIVRQLHLRPMYDKPYKQAVPDAWTFAPAHRDNEQIVHIYRDPRDVAVSVFYYWGRETMVEAIKGIALRPTLPLGIPWQEFMTDWLECEAGVIYLSYEALLENTEAELRRILDELGAEPVHPIDVAIRCQALPAKRYQIEHEPEGARPYNKGIQLKNLRKGIVGDWRNHFGPEEKELAHHYFWPVMQRLGYEDDEEWWMR